MRTKKTSPDRAIASDIGNRIVDMLDELPGSLKAESELLGYKSPSTIYAVRDGNTLPDIVKLWKLAGRESLGRRPNIDWIVTGKGERMITACARSDLENNVRRKLIGQPQDKLEAILTLLGNSST
ncbi:MAG: hypothetical protein JKY50_07895 [Oleispira sp.]|nr:hypothetical protein [Oleispira sp.]MBL4880210.1 hypothetical protein [Oleispira sp.]